MDEAHYQSGQSLPVYITELQTLPDSDNSSTICCSEHPCSSTPLDPETEALRLLSSNLGSLFNSETYSDTHIFAFSTSLSSPTKIPIHLCILSARSPFFKKLFAKEKERKDGYEMKNLAKDATVSYESLMFVAKEPESKDGYEIKELAKDVTVSYESLMVVLRYMYTCTLGALPKDEVRVCADEECDHVGCRPAVDFMLEVLYSSSVFQIPELVSMFQRRLLQILERVAEDDILAILSVSTLCGCSCDKLVSRCISLVTDSKIDTATLKKTLPPDIFKQIITTRGGSDSSNKQVRRIHRALDSDDIELVKLLLKETPSTTLDDAYALHYAVAPCSSKITMEVLDLGLADVNCRNGRGHTVLHTAAIRREPNFIASLLTRGARPSDNTAEGRKAVKISKQLTKRIDARTVKGQPHNDYLCIEILENAEADLVTEGSVSSEISGDDDDIRSRLLHLENRVHIATTFFPKEVKIATGLANVSSTLKFTISDNDPNISIAEQDPDVHDSKNLSFRIREEHITRMIALSRTVELARKYFPRCTRVLDVIMDDDSLARIGNGNETAEEKQQMKKRFHEYEELFSSAFVEDNEDNSREIVTGGPRKSKNTGQNFSSNNKIFIKKNRLNNYL